MRLISIYPEYAKLIKRGSKKYEFRKLIAKKSLQNILKEKYIAVYETSPTSAITMVISVDEVLIDGISNLWSKYGKHSGVDESYFRDYYKDRTKGVAIKIKKVFLIKNPIKIVKIRSIYPNFNPPQNFYSLNEEQYPFIYKKLLKFLKKP